MIIFRFALLKGLRSPMTLLLNCILPLVLMFIRPLWEETGMMGGNAGFGLLVMVIWGGSFLMAQGTLNDKETGVIVRILSAPVSMLNYLTQNLLAYMAPLTVQVFLVSALGMILYDWSFDLALALFVCYTVFTISSVALSFAWNCLFKRKASSFPAFSAMVTFGIFLSGALIPLSLFPDVLQYVGMVFPAYWAIRGIEEAMVYGMTGDYWLSILAMALFTMAFLLYGSKRRMI